MPAHDRPVRLHDPAARPKHDPDYSDPISWWQAMPLSEVTGWDPTAPEGDLVADSNRPYIRQESVLIDFLVALSQASSFGSRYGDLARFSHPPASIFEAGCGQGRITRLLTKIFPFASYAACDVKQEALEAASAACMATVQSQLAKPDGFYPYPPELYLSSIQDLPSKVWPSSSGTSGHAAIPQYDLVVCTEVLMHIPPNELQKAVDILFSMVNRDNEAACLVTIDWDPTEGHIGHPSRPDLDAKIAPHNFAHDYFSAYQVAEAFEPTGRHDHGRRPSSIERHTILGSEQSLFVVKP